METQSNFKGILNISYLLILLLSTLDTHLFVYPSLSQSLLTGMLITLLSCCVLGRSLISKQRLSVSMGQCLVVAWMLFMGLHALLMASEMYRLAYYFISLLLCLTTAEMIRMHLLQWRTIENALLFVAVLQVIAVLYQSIASITGNSNLITGLGENPSVSAIYLTCCCCVVVSRIGKGNLVYVPYLMLLFVTILLLNCRTAYIGLFLLLTILLYRRSRKWRKRIWLWLVVCSILPFLFYGLYHYKQSSSEGRRLIWKITVNMVIDHPMGYGYGLFEKHYNIAQATYFGERKGTKEERMLANQVFMPYNDTLEHTIEGGVLGGTFFLLFFIYLIGEAIRQREVLPMTIFIILLIMSMINFVCTAVPVWLLAMCFGGKVLSKDRQMSFMNGRSLYMMAFVFSFVFLIYELKVIKVQLLLSCMEKKSTVNIQQLESLRTDIGTSERYYTVLGKTYMSMDRYDNAIEQFRNALNYTSSPYIYRLLSICYIKMNNKDACIHQLVTIRNMLPHHLWPNVHLMRTYHYYGDIPHALQYAGIITQMPLKVPSKEAASYQEEARNYIEKYAINMR